MIAHDEEFEPEVHVIPEVPRAEEIVREGVAEVELPRNYPENIPEHPPVSFSEELREIYVQDHVKHCTIKKINRLFKKNGHSELPKTATSFLKTIRTVPLV